MIGIEGMSKTQSIRENSRGGENGVLSEDDGDCNPYYAVDQDEEGDYCYGWGGEEAELGW